jgi:hypothetical protein
MIYGWHLISPESPMPWSRKAGGRYYIRRRKFFGRVFRENMGTGHLGAMAAAADAARRAEEQKQKEALHAEMERWLATQTSLIQLTSATDFLARTALILSGYFKHGGEWRRNTNVQAKRTDEL